MNGALRVNASPRVGSLPAHRTVLARRLGNPGSRLLFAHSSPPATRAYQDRTPRPSTLTQPADKHVAKTLDDTRRSERPIRINVWRIPPGPGFRLVPRNGVSYRASYATREPTARRKELRNHSEITWRRHLAVVSRREAAATFNRKVIPESFLRARITHVSIIHFTVTARPRLRKTSSDFADRALLKSARSRVDGISFGGR